MAQPLTLVVYQGSHTYLVTFEGTSYKELLQAIDDKISKDLKAGEKISHIKLWNDTVEEYIDLDSAEIKTLKKCSKLQVVLEVST